METAVLVKRTFLSCELFLWDSSEQGWAVAGTGFTGRFVADHQWFGAPSCLAIVAMKGQQHPVFPKPYWFFVGGRTVRPMEFWNSKQNSRAQNPLVLFLQYFPDGGSGSPSKK